MEVLKDKNEDVSLRRDAASALVNIASPPTQIGMFPAPPELVRVVPVIIEMLKDEDVAIRRDAAWILDSIYPPAAVPGLTEALKDADSQVRLRAASALYKIDKSKQDIVTPILIEAVRSGDSFTRAVALEPLASIADPAAVPALIEALSDQSLGVRANAMTALGRIGRPAQTAVPILIKVLSDKQGNIRISAAGALGAIGDPAAVPALTRALSGKDKQLCGSAALALYHIDKSKREIAIPVLVETLRDKDASHMGRIRAIWGLVAIGDPAAVTALIEVLKDENSSIRNNAANALETLGTPEAMKAVQDYRKTP